MPRAWRLVSARHAGSALTGEGARLFGGRWNRAGVPVVYTSEHLSLAVLEQLVHLNEVSHADIAAMRMTALCLQFDAALVSRVTLASLPAGWRVSMPTPDTLDIGDDWIAARRTAVLEVPSVVIPDETNFLLNPAHPMFSRIRVVKTEPFQFDPRLAR